MSTNQPHLIEAKFCILLSQPFAISFVSDSIYNLLGFNADHFLSGKINLQSRIHAHDQDVSDELFSLDLNVKSRIFNVRLRHADGRIRCIKGFYSKVITNGTVMLELLLQDAKSLWHPSSDQSTQPSTMTNFKAMMDNTDDYIYFKDRNHVFNGASQALVEITECTQHWSEFLGLTDYDVFLEEYADIYYSLEKQVFAGVNVAHDIQETRLQDGSKGWINNRKFPIKNDDGEIVGLFGIARDITESRLAEEELQKSKAQLQALLRNLPDLVWMKSPEGIYQTCNSRFEQFFGHPESYIIGKTDYDFVEKNLADSFRKNDQTAMMQDSVSTNQEWVTFASDGHRELLETSKVRIYDDKGNIGGILGIAHNITEHNNLELELRKKESYQRALLDNFPFAVWLKDTDSRYLSINKGFVALFGLNNVDELAGKNDYDMTAHDLAENYRADDLAVMNSRLPKNVEEEILTEGVRKWFETYKAPLIDVKEEVFGVVGFARDITDRKQAELDLNIAATAFESQEGMMVTDANQIILRVNKAFTKITGYGADDVVGKTPKVLSSGRHDASFYVDLWNKLNTTGSCVGEIWNKRKNGEIYPQNFTITAVTNRQGLVTHYVNTLVDITDLKRRERDRLAKEADLRDTLVREVHHRIKNNLQGVAGLLRRAAALHPELKEPLTTAISQVHSIALMHGLQGRNAISSILLCDLVAEIASSQKALWQTPIEISQPNDMQYYRIIETETVPLALVFNELIANAIKHGVQAAGIQIRLIVQHSHIAVSIINMGKLSSIDYEKYAPIAGTGLKLVASLLPRKGAQLSWQQHGDYVTTTLEITAPVITLSE